MLRFVLGLLAMTWSYAMSRRGDLRVYNGELDTLNEFPFIVTLHMVHPRYYYVGIVHGCTGSLIADNWVITAAHCFVGTLKFIRYGDFTVPVTESKLHAKVLAQYEPTPQKLVRNNEGPKNDIGLVLVENFPKPHAQLHAVDYNALFGLPAKYAGFGGKNLKQNDPKISAKSLPKFPGLPRVGEGIIIPCKNIEGFGPVICVASKCSNRLQETRPGDSGGPLLQGGRVVGVLKGVTSWLDARKGLIGGGSFTPVSLYLDWITNVMSTHGHKKTRKTIYFS